MLIFALTNETHNIVNAFAIILSIFFFIFVAFGFYKLMLIGGNVFLDLHTWTGDRYVMRHYIL